MFNDNFFKKVENKTNVNKDTIMSLANKLQESNLKDEQALKDVIKNICDLTGKTISKEKEDKIIKTILKDKVPKNIDNFF